MIGQTILHYKIIKKLGAGGMGEVYLATDTKLDRQVALKFLPRHFSADPEARSRFQREAKALAALHHPNIVSVFDVNEHDGQPFIAMEYVKGQSLKDFVESGAVTVNKSIDMVTQIAEGLAIAHKQDITHRDIKSENIILSTDGRVKIMDFGLATWKGVAQITQEGSTVGTRAYMSPQQSHGEEVDHRTDLWSVGVVLYELITGRLPFSGAHDSATAFSISNEDPEPMARYKSGCPDELQRIVTKCLQKDPSRRYQSSSDLAADLRILLAGSSSGSALPAPTMRRPLWKAVATTAVIAALAVVALYIVQNRRTSSPEESERPMLVVLPFENLGSAEDEYFADGITEEITTQVANVSGLGVISRTSSIKYKDTEKSAKQIGEELGVGYILEGTIRWDQSTTPARVRINPQLIRVADDTHLWAESYDRELEHIFATQSDIARQVVAALNVTLLDREDEALAVKPTSNLKAYEAYLRGLEFINMPDFSTQDTRSAIRMFEEAVALDTAFAAAWAQLSQAYSRLDFQGVEDRAGLLDKSKAALDRALTINPELKEALLSAGILAYRTNRDYVTALQYFEHTRKLWPGDRETLGWIAAVYRRQGRFAQAVEQYQKAGTYDPLDSWVNHEIGWTYMRMRRYDEAIEAYDRSIELAPEQTLDYTLRATVYWFKNGDLDAARSSFSSARSNQQDFTHFNWIRQSVLERNFEGALELLGMTTDSVFFTQEYFAPISMYTGYVLTLLDREQDAREAFKAARIQLEEERSRNPDDHRVYSSLGIVQAYLGHEKEAIALGNRGIELFPIEKDAVIGPFRVIDLAHIYTILGEYGSAMDRIEYLMSIPCMLSIAILQLDPRWDSLRDHPRFQALIAKGDTVF